MLNGTVALVSICRGHAALGLTGLSTRPAAVRRMGNAFPSLRDWDKKSPAGRDMAVTRMKNIPIISTLVRYYGIFSHYVGRCLLWLCLIIWAGGLTEGFGFTLIIPSLGASGSAMPDNACVRFVRGFLLLGDWSFPWGPRWCCW